MTKEAMENIVGHKIRLDQYWMIILMKERGMTYSDAKKEFLNNPDVYGGVNDWLKSHFIKESTIIDNINLFYKDNMDNSKVAKKEKDLANLKRSQQRKEERLDAVHKIKETLQPGDYGIYGIYIDGSLIYIGQTRDFHKRFLAYKSELNNCNKDSRVVIKMMQKAKYNKRNVQLKPLITNEEFPNNIITNEQLNAMEYALIKAY